MRLAVELSYSRDFSELFARAFAEFVIIVFKRSRSTYVAAILALRGKVTPVHKALPLALTP